MGDDDPGRRRAGDGGSPGRGDLLRFDSTARSNFFASCSNRIGSTSGLRDNLPGIKTTTIICINLKIVQSAFHIFVSNITNYPVTPICDFIFKF